MKYFVIAVLIFSSHSFAQVLKTNDGCPSGVQVSYLDEVTRAPQSLPKQNQKGQEAVAERRGCCSHHQGVCGCSFGKAVCCDGSTSPSCGCD